MEANEGSTFSKFHVEPVRHFWMTRFLWNYPVGWKITHLTYGKVSPSHFAIPLHLLRISFQYWSEMSSSVCLLGRFVIIIIMMQLILVVLSIVKAMASLFELQVRMGQVTSCEIRASHTKSFLTLNCIREKINFFNVFFQNLFTIRTLFLNGSVCMLETYKFLEISVWLMTQIFNRRSLVKSSCYSTQHFIIFFDGPFWKIRPMMFFTNEKSFRDTKAIWVFFLFRLELKFSVISHKFEFLKRQKSVLTIYSCHVETNVQYSNKKVGGFREINLEEISA